MKMGLKIDGDFREVMKLHVLIFREEISYYISDLREKYHYCINNPFVLFNLLIWLMMGVQNMFSRKYVLLIFELKWHCPILMMQRWL